MIWVTPLNLNHEVTIMSDVDNEVVNELEEEQFENDGVDYVSQPEIYSDSHTTENGIRVLHVSEDNPGHDYLIGVNTGTNDSSFAIIGEINFQNGPTGDHGVNGVTNEAILAVLEHRTAALNEAFPSKENEDALHHLKSAREAFEKRILDRKNRGVYGKNEE